MGNLLKTIVAALLAALLVAVVARIRRVESERQGSESAARLHRQTVEVNDSLVQGMVASRWALESGHLEEGLRILDDTITRGLDLVSTLLRRSDMGGRTEPPPDAAGSNVL